MFTAKYWWVALIQLLLFILFNVGIVLLRKHPKIADALVRLIAAFLLIYKIGEYLYWQCVGENLKIPLEFSALSYFLFSIVMLFRIRKVEPFAVFAALITGIMYTISMISMPDSLVMTRDSVFLLAMAMLNHELLYFGGMLTFIMALRKYSKKDIWIPFVGIGCMVGYSWIVHLFSNYSNLYGVPIFIKISSGTIIHSVIKGAPAFTEGICVVVFLIVLTCAIWGFYVLNNKLYMRNRERYGLVPREPADE